MKETRNETNLVHSYVVIKIADIKGYLDEDERNMFWTLFWSMMDREEATKDDYAMRG
jgi:hypothetical protein